MFGKPGNYFARQNLAEGTLAQACALARGFEQRGLEVPDPEIFGQAKGVLLVALESSTLANAGYGELVDM